MAGIVALFMTVGYSMGGQLGMLLALGFAGITNFIAYYNSDKMVLARYRAQPLQTGKVVSMVRELAEKAGLPMPKVYVLNNPQPNAFATGRNPQHAAVAVTTGLMEILSDAELRGVIAHELAHIQNRDTLIMTVAATVSGAIGSMANFGRMFGGGRGRSADQRGAGGALGGMLIMFLAPFAAMIVQMTISRTREYAADKRGAEICGDPVALADALRKISGIATRVRNREAEHHPASAHLFIFNPLKAAGLKNLFSTHPDVNERIRRLEAMV